METDGISLKQIILGEAAEHNHRSENKVVQIGQAFIAPEFSPPSKGFPFRFCLPCQTQPPGRRSTEHRHSFHNSPSAELRHIRIFKRNFTNKTITSRKIIKLPKYFLILRIPGKNSLCDFDLRQLK